MALFWVQSYGLVNVPSLYCRLDCVYIGDVCINISHEFDFHVTNMLEIELNSLSALSTNQDIVLLFRSTSQFKLFKRQLQSQLWKVVSGDLILYFSRSATFISLSFLNGCRQDFPDQTWIINSQIYSTLSCKQKYKTGVIHSSKQVEISASSSTLQQNDWSRSRHNWTSKNSSTIIRR